MGNAAELDPAVLALLAALWEAAGEGPGTRPWSTAKLGKRSGLPMSVVLRTLAALETAGLAEVSENQGRRCAVLGEAGRTLCRAVFGGQ